MAYQRDRNNLRLTGSWGERAVGRVIRNVGGLNPLLSEKTRRRGEPPFKSVRPEPRRSVKSTSNAGQKKRLAAAARSARRNAADVSMNNPPTVTDFGGHAINPKTGKRMHSFGTERDK